MEQDRGPGGQIQVRLFCGPGCRICRHSVCGIKNTKRASQLPIHLTIWTVALLTYLVAHRGRVLSEAPFNGFHSARFEVSDDTVYYVYQQGLKLKTYYIRDANIKKIRRDDESGVLCIEGKATINIQSRNDETEESLDKFYALVPFDKYELDDLLAPYKRKVVKADGTLRQKYSEELSS